MTTWSAISAFSLCCSHWTPPAVIPSAASASETSYRRRISVRWTGRDSTLSHVRSLAFWFINSWTNCWFRVHFPQCAMTWCSAVTWKAILRTGEQEKGESGSRLCGKAAQADRSQKHEYKTYRQKVSFYNYQYFFFNVIYLAVWDLSCGHAVSIATLSCSMWDLVPWPGIKPRPPALGAQSFSHWTTREVSLSVFLVV